MYIVLRENLISIKEQYYGLGISSAALLIRKGKLVITILHADTMK